MHNQLDQLSGSGTLSASLVQTERMDYGKEEASAWQFDDARSFAS
jgi:hypothetical protein